MIEIAIPVYNGENTIYRTLLSLKDIEYPIKIYDNASMDKTLEVIENFKNTYSKNIKIIKNEINTNVTENIKRCFQNSTCDYTLLLSSNDVVKNNYLKIVSKDIKETKPDLILRNYDWFYKDIKNVTRKKKEEKFNGFLNFNDENHCVIFLDKADQLSGLIFKNSEVLPILNRILNKPFVEILSLCIFYLEKRVFFYNNYFVSADGGEGGSSSKAAYLFSPIESLDNIIPREIKKMRKVKTFLSLKYTSLIQIKICAGFVATAREIKNFIKLHPKLLLNIKFLSISLILLILPGGLIEKIKIKFKHKVSKYFDY